MTPRPPEDLTSEEMHELRELLSDGDHTYAEIAQVFDVARNTVTFFAQRFHLTKTDLKTTAAASTPAAVNDAEGVDSPSSPSASPLPLLSSGAFPDWMARGICHETDPESFFPEKGGSTREAKTICASCPVQAECLDYALDNDERFGIWGGLSERERRAVKQALQKDAGVEQLACTRCDETFTNAQSLAAHARHTHDRPDETFTCPACDHTSTAKQGITMHIRAAHPELRNAS